MSEAVTDKPRAQTRSVRSRIIPLLSRYAPVVCLVLLIVIFTVLTDGRFLKPLNLFNVMRQISIEGLIAVGMTFVILTAGIDLSVGSLVAVAGLSAALIAKGSAASSFSLSESEATGYGWFAAMLGAIAVGVLGGMIQGTAITKLKVPPFVVTLGGLSVFRGMALMISGSGPISGFDEAYRWWGQGRIGPVPVPVIIFLAIAAVAFVVLRYTRYGRQVYAVGGNREAARLAGVNVERVLLSVYVIIGFLAGVSPIMHDFWQAEDPNQRTNDMVNFAKNMALLGGAAALAAVKEPWPASVPFARPGKMQRVRRALRKSIAA